MTERIAMENAIRSAVITAQARRWGIDPQIVLQNALSGKATTARLEAIAQTNTPESMYWRERFG